MPWRQKPSFYFVVVSELMLQQTQVARVVPKFMAFVERFPNFKALAAAPLGDVLAAWNGLGYNRRAKFLWQLAAKVQDTTPTILEELVALPGIGPNTAGAIMAYAFNFPAVFIETNIRTVFIYHFFENAPSVTDSQIKQKVAATLPKQNIREWYWALMDYGSFLKATADNQLQKVQGYKKQNRFAGSLRQVRGRVIKQLIGGPQKLSSLQKNIADERLPAVLAALQQEGMVHYKAGWYCI